MKKSKINPRFNRGQISKIQIKDKIFLVFNLILLLFVSPLSVFAHESEMLHEETVPTISPLLLVGLVAVFAIGGFLLWKFVLHGSKSSSSAQPPLPDKTPTVQEKTVSRNDQSDNSQKNV